MMMKKSWPRRRELEEEEAEEVVVVELEGEEKGGGGEEVRWESFLPRGSLRVLLVEGDDSTRQIIAALLRKCNYKVVAVSDGMKGWEILKERPQSIDLVLVELEVPSVSGLALLDMIMDHDVCKNIPVIMMSSQDSINMVYKCMLKGAADFLVKPIRRNELRNLWQHVWRRQFLTDGQGGTNVHQDGNLAKRKHEDMSEKENHLSGYVPPLQKIKQCSEKGSVAESSCTRSDMEAESTYKQNMQESEQTTWRSSPLSKNSVGQNGKDQIQRNGSLPMHKGVSEDVASMPASEVKPFDLEGMSSEQAVEEECSCPLTETMNEDPKEAIDLIGAMENQPESGYGLRDYTANEMNLSSDPKVIFDNSYKSSYIPLLELSLRRYPRSGFEEERGECSTLHHSNSSAFSQYNSRVPTPFTPITFPADSEEGLGTNTRFIPDQVSGNSSSVPSWYGATPNMKMAPTQSGKAIKCSPLRVIPLPLPVRAMNVDLSSGYGPLMMPMFYPQPSAAPVWNNIPSMWQEADHKDHPRQHVQKDVYSFHGHQTDDQSPRIPNRHSEQMQESNMEPRDKQMHVSSVGDSGSSSICNGMTNNLIDTGTENFCNAINRPDSCNASAEVGNGEVKQLNDIYRLSQREAALNKFRMKRKDRCFEKKVRYQSRKKLAEQRPRVKGQFVRHVQPEPPSTEV